MSTDADITPIERPPLLRSDLNEIRDIVHSISQRQLAFHADVKSLTTRVSKIEQHLWLPALVSIVAAALAVMARLS